MSSPIAPQIPTSPCVCCTDTFPTDPPWETLCGCLWCIPCLEQDVRTRLADKSFLRPMCCGRVHIWSEVSALIDDDLADAFEDKMWAFEHTIPVYCTDKTCPMSGALIGAEHQWPNDATAICPVCDRVVCTKCKKTSHADECTPDVEIEGVLELAKAEGWRRCRYCGEMIELMNGCSRMMCVCGFDFCYDCGLEVGECDDRGCTRDQQTTSERAR